MTMIWAVYDYVINGERKNGKRKHHLGERDRANEIG